MPNCHNYFFEVRTAAPGRHAVHHGPSSFFAVRFTRNHFWPIRNPIKSGARGSGHGSFCRPPMKTTRRFSFFTQIHCPAVFVFESPKAHHFFGGGESRARAHLAWAFSLQWRLKSQKGLLLPEPCPSPHDGGRCPITLVNSGETRARAPSFRQIDVAIFVANRILLRDCREVGW